MAIKPSKSPPLLFDGVFGTYTYNSMGVRTFVELSNSEPFVCPHCGGTQSEIRNGKKVCAYCLSEMGQ